MPNDIYNGTSEGMDFLVDGYIEYAKEVITNRALTDVRDGFKTVGRRIVEGSRKIKGVKRKSGTYIGEITKLHPHSEDAVYGAMVLMTDKNGSMTVPLFKGQGQFGTVGTAEPPAARRYTEVEASPYMKYYTRDYEVVHMIPSETGDDVEPEVIPVRFPAALTNGTNGLAVSVSTMVPSFNLLDVLNLTMEYLRTGECNTIIAPDFPTGGVVVKNDTELMKIMTVGKGNLKVRAKVEINGKEIKVKEVPFGKTLEGIIKSINECEDLKDVTGVFNSKGYESNEWIVITCKNKRVVEEVLLKLYKHRILQTTYPCNMLFTDKSVPVQLGVYGVVERWVKWRCEVCTEMFKNRLEGVEAELERLGYFIKVVMNDEWNDTLSETIRYKSKRAGVEYIKEVMPGIPSDVADWITDRRTSAFNKNESKYVKRVHDLEDTREVYQGYINSIKAYVLSDLEEMYNEVKDDPFFNRKTLITNKDYKFSKIEDSEIIDDSPCVYAIHKSGFMRKVRTAEEAYMGDDLDFVIPGYANSVLIGFDCYGRILRVYGSDFPFTKYDGRGEYLYKYFDAEDYDGEYSIKYMCLLDGSTKMLLYKDGFVGYLDTSEFEGKKRVRTVQNGVDLHVYDELLDVIDVEDINISNGKNYLLALDVTEKGQLRLGVTDVRNIRVAGRKSRAKVFNGKDPKISHYTFMSYVDLCKFVEDPMYFIDRMRPIKDKEVYGDESVLTEGRY